MSGDLPHWRSDALLYVGRFAGRDMRQLSSLSGFICSRAVLRGSCVATLTKRTDQVFFPVLDSILRVGIRPQHERVMHTVYPSHSATLRGNVCRGIKLQTGCASTSRSSSAVSTPLPPSQLTGCHMLYGLWLAALEHQRLKRRTYEG